MKIIFFIAAAASDRNGKTDAADFSEALLFLLVILSLEKIEFLLDPVYRLDNVELETRRWRSSVTLAWYLKIQKNYFFNNFVQKNCSKTEILFPVAKNERIEKQLAQEYPNSYIF